MPPPTEAPNMLPLLFVALLIWAGVWGFTFSVDRKVARLEARVREIQSRRDGVSGDGEGNLL